MKNAPLLIMILVWGMPDNLDECELQQLHPEKQLCPQYIEGKLSEEQHHGSPYKPVMKSPYYSEF